MDFPGANSENLAIFDENNVKGNKWNDLGGKSVP